jgi:hypothetical protein
MPVTELNVPVILNPGESRVYYIIIENVLSIMGPLLPFYYQYEKKE